MNRRYPLSLAPTPAFGLGWLCNHVRGAVQLPGEAAYESSCARFMSGSKPQAVVLAADWTDVEAARHFAEENGFDIVSSHSAIPSTAKVLFVRKPNLA